jgi:hypothetical protein
MKEDSNNQITDTSQTARYFYFAFEGLPLSSGLSYNIRSSQFRMFQKGKEKQDVIKTGKWKIKREIMQKEAEDVLKQ